MAVYRYTVEVECETQDQADQVIVERINYDEDYGFDYSVHVVEED